MFTSLLKRESHVLIFAQFVSDHPHTIVFLIEFFVFNLILADLLSLSDYHCFHCFKCSAFIQCLRTDKRLVSQKSLAFTKSLAIH